jgi:hypothetical protein
MHIEQHYCYSQLKSLQGVEDSKNGVASVGLTFTSSSTHEDASVKTILALMYQQ